MKPLNMETFSKSSQNEKWSNFMQPTTVKEEDYNICGVPIQTKIGEEPEQHFIEFETALMALEPFKKIQQPCPKKTLNFGVLLTKKNFDYLKPSQIEKIKER